VPGLQEILTVKSSPQKKALPRYLLFRQCPFFLTNSLDGIQSKGMHSQVPWAQVNPVIVKTLFFSSLAIILI
jgi:hypothetical protein